ncbi:MAG: amidohydrolase family protein [Deltaproteobacteria bacterium]|nr:MAG: amidohydrolase family protein [Deltaproteobacteria bacterium]
MTNEKHFGVPPRRRVPASPSRLKFLRPILHRASFVFPITRPPIEDGAVLVAEGVIEDVGPFRLLRRQWPSAQVCEHQDGALLPALVNAHTHLDLSGLAGKVPAQGGMAQWIRRLLAAKERMNGLQLELAHQRALTSMRSFGTGIVADINSSARFAERIVEGTPITRTFLEVLGLQTDSLEQALNRFPERAQQILADGQEEISLSAHAPYTTSAALLREVKAWSGVREKTVPVHVAESEEEIMFLQSGRGPLRDLLEERGLEPDRWSPPGCGPVTYLDRLGCLDRRTLCIHAVKVSKEEIELLSRTEAGVCLCPRSNLFLGHGLPPVGRFLDAGVSCGLGTDSLASNDDLNLFNEMAVLVERCGIDPETVLSMATLHGARNLGLVQRYGSLEKGKRWLAIRVGATDGESIVAAGCRGEVEWVT